MAPVIEEFRVSVHAEQHMLYAHGVSLDEAIEAAESTPRQSRTYGTPSGASRYVIPGKTSAGRRLWVVFADEGGRIGRIVTAYDPLGRRDATKHRKMRGD
jgi:uncharacterized DUF497 family protein